MKLSFKAGMSAMVVVIVVSVGIATIRAQGEVAIAQSFLDAVTKGDKAAAEALSDGAVRASVKACLAGPCDATPSGRAIVVLRGSMSNSTSKLMAMSWNGRCVTARSRLRAGGSVELFVLVERRGEAWLVTGVSESRDDLLPLCSND